MINMTYVHVRVSASVRRACVRACVSVCVRTCAKEHECISTIFTICVLRVRAIAYLFVHLLFLQASQIMQRAMETALRFVGFVTDCDVDGLRVILKTWWHLDRFASHLNSAINPNMHAHTFFPRPGVLLPNVTRAISP